MVEYFGNNSLGANREPLSKKRWAIFLLLLVLAVSIRWHDLGRYPRPNETFDEEHYLWAGLSLLHEGRAKAWSFLDYQKCGVTPQKVVLPTGETLLMVTPAMDHPPLFSLIAGAFATLTSSASLINIPQPNRATYPIWQINLGTARLLSIILYAISFYLLFQITHRAFSFPTACLAVLFYGVIDHIVFHSRLLVTENFTTPLFLLNLYVLQGYVGGQRTRRGFGLITVFCCGAALLCKVIAISQAAAIIFLLVLCRKWRDSIFPLLGALLGVVLYAGYGWWQGWGVFKVILSAQAGRFYGFDAIVRIVTGPSIVHTADLNLLLLAGWIALFALAAFHRRARILLAPLVYLLAFIYFTSAPAIYGWHIIPFYPFLCMALAVLITRTYRRHRPTDTAALMVLLLPVAFGTFALSNMKEWALVLRIGYLFFALCALLAPFYVPKRRRIVIRFVIIGVVCLVVLQQAWSSWNRKIVRLENILESFKPTQIQKNR